MGKILVAGVALVAGLVVGVRDARAQTAAGQVSVWLQKDVSGFGAEAGIDVSDPGTDFVLYGGYSHRGFLEFDLAFHYLVFDDNEQLTDLTAVAIAPGIHFHPLKQNAEMPISLAIDAEVAAIAASSPGLEDAGITVTGVQGSIGASLYRFFRLGPSIGVTPSAGFRLTRNMLTFRDEFDEVITEATDDSVLLVLRGNFGFLDSRGTIYGVTPSLSLGDTTSFGVMFGMIWSLQRH